MVIFGLDKGHLCLEFGINLVLELELVGLDLGLDLRLAHVEFGLDLGLDLIIVGHD